MATTVLVGDFLDFCRFLEKIQGIIWNSDPYLESFSCGLQTSGVLFLNLR